MERTLFMKRTLYFLIAVIALLTAASCQKEAQPQAGAGAGDIITCVFAANTPGGTAPGTKSTIVGHSPIWSTGDQVYLYDKVNPSEHNTTIILGTTPGAVIAADGRSFTFTRPGGWSPNLCAVYPADAFLQDVVGMPRIRFDNQDGTFAKANICAAMTSGSVLSFVNESAILMFTGKPAEVREIVLPISAVTNYHTIMLDDGNNPHHLGITPAMMSNIIHVGDGTGPVFIAVPDATLAAGATFTYRSATHEVLGSRTTENPNTLQLNKIYNLGAITSNGVIPDVLPLYFTVGLGGRKVRFSKGNLKVTTTDSWSTSTWGFYDHQYDYNSLNSSASRTALSTDTEIDLFTWGYNETKSVNPIGKDDDNVSRTTGNLDTTTEDWGCKIGVPGAWRTLTGSNNDMSEWKYLLTSRGTGDTYFKLAVTVAGKANCLVIAPDGNTTAIADSYTAEEWAAAEKDLGLVCLPAAGSRSEYDGQSISDIGAIGNYWSSTIKEGGSNAYYLYFDNSSTGNSTDVYPRSNGFAVRLVTNL